MKRLIFNRIVIATHNAGKLREFSDLLRPYVKEIVSAGDLKLPEPEETGTTFAENAVLKAKAAALASNCLALADDSGLCVTALGGKPGIHSARWAEPKNNFAHAMQRVGKELDKAKDRSAYFTCVLALCWPNGKIETVEGRIDGTIAHTMRGTRGHGYDPIFIPNGYDITFAVMDEKEKNRISHRGLATKSLIEHFFKKPNR
ncbi:MAG: RdgB/HAM1 family non-canonical purine NTP pyrophosphatase [Bdellovibrionales bacterium]|jgi:XTP/dITP diphosphohydrolase